MRHYSRRMRKPRKRTKRRSQKGGANIPTFHILLCTGGKPVLKAMIDSLKGELLEGDAMTIIFDGQDALKKSTFTDEWTSGFKCAIKKIEENPALGFWGHGARNKYQGQLTPRTTFIMNADDDDTYIAGSFAKLREKCVDPNTLYITKMTYVNDRKTIIPRQNKEIIFGDISTQNGVIPFDMAAKGEWKPKYGGDFDYYTDLKKLNSPIVFLDELIYLKGGPTSPQSGGGSEISAVCAIMIKEEKYVDEWIQYYLYGLGFTKVYIYDNSDENSLKDLPKKYENVIIIHFPGKVKQFEAYNDWLLKNRALPDGERVKWCAIFDADEFLVLKKHANITEFLREYCSDPNTGGIAINWYLYGDSNLKEPTEEPVTKRFTRRGSTVNEITKAIIQCENTKMINDIHGMNEYINQARLKDTAGKTLNAGLNPDGPADVAVINHYFTKTRPEYEIKRMRGRADIAKTRNSSEFDAHNFNEVEDDSAYKIYLKAQENMPKGQQGGSAIHPIDLVIARFSEDLGWIRNLPKDMFRTIYVYNKGPDMTKITDNMRIESLPNLGREAHTYLYHIIHHFPHEGEISTTVFVPGSVYSKHHKLSQIDKILEHLKRFPSKSVIVENKHERLNTAKDFSINHYSITNEGNRVLNPNVKLNAANTNPLGPWFEKYIPNEQMRCLSTNGIFAATSHDIRKHSKNFYETLIKTVSTKNPVAVHYMERVWANIMSIHNCI